MTEVDALAAMKRKCKVLADGFTDAELIGFLNDYRTGTDPDYTYDIKRSTYDALTSLATGEYTSWSAGGISYTKDSLLTMRRQFATVGSVACVRE